MVWPAFASNETKWLRQGMARVIRRIFSQQLVAVDGNKRSLENPRSLFGNRHRIIVLYRSVTAVDFAFNAKPADT